MKKYFCVLLLLFLCMDMFALTLTGRVVESATGEPVIGARIRVYGTGTGTVTDLNGNYTLEDISGGVNIEVSRLPYITQLHYIPTGTTGTLVMNFEMDEDEGLIFGNMFLAELRKEYIGVNLLYRKEEA